MKIFLDTEYTHIGADAQLISIGMVVGHYMAGIYHPQEELYLELPFELRYCTEFVQLNVLPYLNNYPGCQVTWDNIRFTIINWLNLVSKKGETITICSDSEWDVTLFKKALDNRIPPNISYQNIGENLSYPRMFRYYELTQLPEHHALNDAKANCYSFKEEYKLI